MSLETMLWLWTLATIVVFLAIVAGCLVAFDYLDRWRAGRDRHFGGV